MLHDYIFYQINYSQSVHVKTQNPAQELRVLNLDNKNYCEIVFLKFLQVLQNQINFSYSVQENFDVTFDISSDKYKVLNMFSINTKFK